MSYRLTSIQDQERKDWLTFIQDHEPCTQRSNKRWFSNRSGNYHCRIRELRDSTPRGERIHIAIERVELASENSKVL
jgi:hypothetical protein